MLTRKLTIYIILLFSAFANAQKSTADIELNSLKEIISKNNIKKTNYIIFDFIDTRNEKNFVDDANYYQFLSNVDTFFNEQEDYYAEVVFMTGKKLHGVKQYKESFGHLYKVQLFINSGKKYDFECDFYEIMGLSYFFFKRYEQSKTFLKKALNCGTTTDLSKLNIYNTLGLIYNNESNKEGEATKNYQKAIELAQKINSRAWYGVASGNLGVVYFKKQEFDLAKKYLEIDVSVSTESGEIESAISALSMLLEIDILEKNDRQAKVKIHIIDSLATANKLTNEITYYESKAIWAEHSKNYYDALHFQRIAQNMRDSVNRIRNEVNANNTEFQIDFEHEQAQIKILQEQTKTSKKINFVLLILLITILVGAYVTIRQILKRKKKEKEVLELKNKQVKEDLERSEHELQNILKNLMERNETISKLTEELEGVFSKMSSNEEEHKSLTDKLQTFTLLTDDDWVQFKRLFEKRYPGFFDYFYSNFEDITNAELRLAALLKLNLENLEISKTLGISADSVRKTNLRLRKRLDIAEQKDLQKLIQSIG